jgi:hypothetical protein
LILGVNQIAVRQRLPLYQTQNRVSEQVWVLPVVEAERELVQIGVQVLDGELVVRTDYGAVKQAPDAFGGVRVNLATYPFLSRVVDPLMDGVLVTYASVGAVSVRVDRLGVVCDNVFEEGVNGFVSCVGSTTEPDATTALDCAENDGLVVQPSERRFLSGAEPAHLPADVGFVRFHDAAQGLRVLFSHRGTDAVAEIPSGLVTHAEHPLELVRGDSLTRLAHDIDGEKPLPERELGIVEQRPHADRELVAA